MSGGAILALACAAYLVVAAGVLGALLERERLQNPDGERGWRWLGALMVSVLFWPVLGLLWGSSRPVPPQASGRIVGDRTDPNYGPWRLAPPEGWEGDWTPGPGRVIQQMPPAPRWTPTAAPVATSRDLENLDVPEGTLVFIENIQHMAVRMAKGVGWFGHGCSCRWNEKGYPVVLCRMMRSDLDPQGEPDDDEGSVGR